MSNPITPLTPEQVAANEAQAASEGWFHRALVSIDQTTNVVLLKGRPDETISSHAARAAEEGKTWGKVASTVFGWFQSDHGPRAQAGDLERAQAIEKTEKDSGGLE